ncbi:glycosyltransferase family 2 protein [Sphingomicrobium sp. XHP0239]|uniref:glycosyltransferase family 2 protein n=1 Tax=Sphingomicrobium maritimum TaxID=3133972 RepID=UPI0031CC9604
MKFSICVPNYNYAGYVGETLRSVLTQDADVEVIVADNASSDDSVAVVEALDDDRIELRRNATNVGFAGNLDRATRGASGDRMILLSSDDLAEPEALPAYRALADALGPASERAIFGSTVNIIDGEGRKTGSGGFPERFWSSAKIDPELSEQIGHTVYRAAARDVLRDALSVLQTPYAFATTCYPRKLYEALEGYVGGYLYNPDKMFAWRLLAIADEAFFIDAPLFSYRVHDANQQAGQRASGALKHLMDQYRATFDIDPAVLDAAGLDKTDLAAAFIEQDIALRGLRLVAEGERKLARRGLDFGRAAYPGLVGRSTRIAQLRALLAMGPLGSAVAKRRLDKALSAYRDGAFR